MSILCFTTVCACIASPTNQYHTQAVLYPQAQQLTEQLTQTQAQLSFSQQQAASSAVELQQAQDHLLHAAQKTHDLEQQIAQLQQQVPQHVLLYMHSVAIDTAASMVCDCRRSVTCRGSLTSKR